MNSNLLQLGDAVLLCIARVFTAKWYHTGFNMHTCACLLQISSLNCCNR